MSSQLDREEREGRGLWTYGLDEGTTPWQGMCADMERCKRCKDKVGAVQSLCVRERGGNVQTGALGSRLDALWEVIPVVGAHRN